MQSLAERIQQARTAPSEHLWTIIQRATPPVLEAVLDNPACEPFHVITILRNIRVTPELTERIYQDARWMQHYRVKVALVRCRQTPYYIASHLVYELFWRDLVQVAQDYRVDPRVRHAAERIVMQKMEEMSIGEKMALAKIATRRLIVHIRNTVREGPVLIELLHNPRLIEEDVVALLQVPQLPVEFIRALAARPQWCYRAQVRTALVRHPHTPLHVVRQILPRLSTTEVQALLHEATLRPMVRRLLREHRARR